MVELRNMKLASLDHFTAVFSEFFKAMAVLPFLEIKEEESYCRQSIFWAFNISVEDIGTRSIFIRGNFVYYI